jgi:hypothetical protein
MTSRVLLAIGCDAYDHENPLDGAEHDAERVFDALMRPELGDYDPARSELLRSPTAGEVRAAIGRVLFGAGDIDTFTFFFAGHGAVESGSFYMLLKDTPARGLSIAALSLSDVFRAINEAAPGQSNIFIDACEAGGLVADLGTLLKSDLIGDAGTPGVTLVATAGQDQGAGETPAGGVGTNALLDVIEGRDPLNDTAPAFDLVEIGRRVSTRLRDENDQTPVVWGLNLYGPPRFCRNIRAGGDPTLPLREVLQAWPASSDVNVRQRFEELWRVYAAVSDEWDPRAFARAVDPILAALAANPAAQAAVVERLSAACLERALLSADVFRPAQVGTALAACLLPFRAADAVARQLKLLIDQIGDALLAAARALLGALQEDRYALLSRRGSGVSDLFLLPLRIADILGWTAAASLMFEAGDARCAEARQALEALLAAILEHYSTSVVTVSDAQAAPYWLALSQAIALGLTSQAETLAGLLFGDLIARRANVARGDIAPESILEFLTARAAGDYSSVLELLERPDEITAVVLRAGARLGLADVFDQDLWEIDDHTFSAYVTSAHDEFGLERMENGQNLVWTIGETVFRVADLDLAGPAALERPEGHALRATLALASLTYPDRVAWFLLEAAQPDGSQLYSPPPVLP